MVGKYSPPLLASTFQESVTREDVEEELFSIRAMRHVFRVKRNASLDEWTRLLQPIQARGFPAHWLLTSDEGVISDRTTWADFLCRGSPNCQHAEADGTTPDHRHAAKNRWRKRSDTAHGHQSADAA